MQALRMRNCAPFVMVSLVLLLAVGCGTNAEETPAEDTASTKTTVPVDIPAGQPVEYAASHVLIQYVGSQRAGAQITRTKEESLALAQEVETKAKSGEDFEALAREYSDGPTAPRGGNLGIFWSNRMVPEFSQACSTLAVGQISDPVETAFGYHVIRRNNIEKVSARHILVMHTGSERVPPTITRTREEALAWAEEALEKARGGADFGALAGEYSDGPSAPRGGDLGSFGKGAMVPAFDETVFALEVGEISGIVDTPFGYHIILRYE